MKIKLLLQLILVLFISSLSFAQFDKPVFQFGFGIVQPQADLKGDQFVNYTNNYYTPVIGSTISGNFALVDSNLFANNYGAKTGIYIHGVGKINVDKYEIFRLIGELSYSSFNTFESAKSGFTPLFVRSGNNVTWQPYPISYDYSFGNFGIGLGVELAPTSFTKLMSPFFDAMVSMNFFNAKLTRTTGVNDTTSATFDAFRIGVKFGTGLEFKVSNQWGFVLGAKYDLGNLLLKSNDQVGLVEWGRSGASINDEGGTFLSNLPYALGDFGYGQFNSKTKAIDWATFYIGVNFYPIVNKTTKK